MTTCLRSVWSMLLGASVWCVSEAVSRGETPPTPSSVAATASQLLGMSATALTAPGLSPAAAAVSASLVATTDPRADLSAFLVSDSVAQAMPTSEQLMLDLLSSLSDGAGLGAGLPSGGGPLAGAARLSGVTPMRRASGLNHPGLGLGRGSGAGRGGGGRSLGQLRRPANSAALHTTTTGHSGAGHSGNVKTGGSPHLNFFPNNGQHLNYFPKGVGNPGGAKPSGTKGGR